MYVLHGAQSLKLSKTADLGTFSNLLHTWLVATLEGGTQLPREASAPPPSHPPYMKPSKATAQTNVCIVITGIE